MSLKQLAGWALWLIVMALPLTAFCAEPAKVTLASQSEQIKTVEARVTIDAPPSAVWDVITNYGNLKNVLPGYEKTQVIADGGNTATVDMALKAGALMPTFKYRVHISENQPAGTVIIKRLSGDFNSILGTYRLMPTKGGTQTLLVYSLKIDLGNKLAVPGAGTMLKNSTEKGMNAMQRACAESYRRSLTAQR